MKKVAIVQSNYIPWKGYFDLIAFVDEFIVFDEMQYTRRDWRNRNRIKTPNGVQWLTVPVQVKGKYLQRISETRINDPELIDDKSERLASLCTQAGGTEYVCGPSTREYMDPTVFKQAGLTLSWFDYSGYPEYPQLWGDFEHSVTILDLLFNCGGEAQKYMKFVGGSRTV